MVFVFCFFFLMIRRPPRSTRTDTLVPYTTLFRSEHTELFVCFGGASAKNAQVSAGGPGQHMLPGSLQAMAEKGTQIVNISPLKDDLHSGADFQWIAIKPNTDMALMLELASHIHEADRRGVVRGQRGSLSVEPGGRG